MSWSTSATLILGATCTVMALLIYFSWSRLRAHGRRLVATATLLVIVGVFATLARSDRNEQHFTGDLPTGPALGRPTFQLVAVGDFGTANDQEVQVSQAMQGWVDTYETDAFLNVGDAIYPEGARRYFQKSWTEPYGWVEDEDLSLISALGNHDTATGDGGRAVMDLLDMPGPWYRTAVGDADVIVLDSNRPEDPEQQAWLLRQLRSLTRRWSIVVFHQPPYSCSRSGNEIVRDAWSELLEAEAVDLVMSGHEHNYQRFESPAGTTYIITGGGGDALYPVDDCQLDAATLVASNDRDHHFLVLAGSADRLVGQVIGMDGSLLDEFSLEDR